MSACRKSDYTSSQVTPVNPNTHWLLDMGFSYLKGGSQQITVVAGVYTEVRLSKGTKLKFYPYSFKDGVGNLLNGDTIRLSVLELYGAGAGIANRSVNLSGNQLLKNNGELYITAARDGGSVAINKYGVCFLASAHSQEQRDLYYGHSGNEDSTIRWNRVGLMTGAYCIGTVLDTQSVYLVDTSGTKVDTTNVYRNYNVFDSCAALGWVGCAYPYQATTQLTNISVSPASSDFNNSNTAVFLVFPQINAVVPVTDYDSASHVFSLPNGYEVPSDITAHLVVIGYNGSTLYYYQQTNFLLGRNMSIIPILRPYSLNEILNMLYLL